MLRTMSNPARPKTRLAPDFSADSDANFTAFMSHAFRVNPGVSPRFVVM